MIWSIIILLLTLYPSSAFSQPRPTAKTTLTAYCLAGNTTSSGAKVFVGCIALSQSLRSILNAKFGDIIEIEGHGLYVYADWMPFPRWKRNRADIHYPVYKKAFKFGIKFNCKIKVVGEVGRFIGPDPDGDWETAVSTGKIIRKILIKGGKYEK